MNEGKKILNNYHSSTLCMYRLEKNSVNLKVLLTYLNHFDGKISSNIGTCMHAAVSKDERFTLTDNNYSFINFIVKTSF